MENETRQKTGTPKKRNPLIALIFSIIYPGFGQLYNGQLTKAILLGSIYSIISLIDVFTNILASFDGLLILLIISIFLGLFTLIDAVKVARQLNSYRLKSFNRSLIYVSVILLSIGVNFGSKMIRTSELQAYKIPSTSMEESIFKGDIIMSDNSYYNSHKARRNELVVFSMPGADNAVCKRVIAIPGDTLEIKDKIVYINGEKEEAGFAKYVDEKIITAERGPRDNMEPLVIQDDFYFVMGDNRDVSKDSRYFGEIHKTDLIGKLKYIYFSYGKEPLDNYKDIIKDFSGRLPERKSRIRFERIGKKLL